MWISLDAEPLDAGSVGGDIQRGAAWSRRFVWADDAGRPVKIDHLHLEARGFALITDHAYAVDVKDGDEPDGEETHPFDVQEQLEHMFCEDIDDPGSTEIWCDHEYDFPFDIGFTELDTTDASAKDYIVNSRPSDFGDPMLWGMR